MTTTPDGAGEGARGGSPKLWLLAAVLAIVLVIETMLTIDTPVREWAHGVRHTHAVWQLGWFVGWLGDWVAQVYGIVLLLVLWRWRRSPRCARAAALVPLVFVVSGIVCAVTKGLTQRPRPYNAEAAWSVNWGKQVLTTDRDFLSMPSGDVTSAAGLAAVFLLTVGRGRARWLFLGAPVGVGVWRVAAEQHYPSDCIAGMLLGVATAALIWRWLGPKREPDAAAGPDERTGG